LRVHNQALTHTAIIKAQSKHFIKNDKKQKAEKRIAFLPFYDERAV
jgi:hypothetical protein